MRLGGTYGPEAVAHTKKMGRVGGRKSSGTPLTLPFWILQGYICIWLNSNVAEVGRESTLGSLGKASSASQGPAAPAPA